MTEALPEYKIGVTEYNGRSVASLRRLNYTRWRKRPKYHLITTMTVTGGYKPTDDVMTEIRRHMRKGARYRVWVDGTEVVETRLTGPYPFDGLEWQKIDDTKKQSPDA